LLPLLTRLLFARFISALHSTITTNLPSSISLTYLLLFFALRSFPRLLSLALASFPAAANTAASAAAVSGASAAVTTASHHDSSNIDHKITVFMRSENDLIK
jgi:hypothetical protein